MHGEVADAMTRVENEARVLVLTGAGRGFCAGQDLSERRPAADGTPPDLGETVDKYYGPLVRRINALPMPVVVGVNGVAAGRAPIWLSPAISSSPGIGQLHPVLLQARTDPRHRRHLRAATRSAARARGGLALLGDKLSAKQAQDWGLIWQCVADTEFDATLERLAQHFAKAPTKGLAFTSAPLQASLANDLATQLDLERDMMRELGRSADYAEGVAAFLDKREPQFKGHDEHARSPA